MATMEVASFRSSGPALRGAVVKEDASLSRGWCWVRSGPPFGWCVPCSCSSVERRRQLQAAEEAAHGQGCRSPTIGGCCCGRSGVTEFMPPPSSAFLRQIWNPRHYRGMLYMNLEQEEELRILQEAASIYAQWRRSQEANIRK